MRVKFEGETFLWLIIFIYILVFGTLTSLRHYQFQTQAMDMGIFDQLFWNTLHGQFMQSSIEEIPNHFGLHFSPILLLLVPGYALFPSPYYLLLVQTIVLALGAWPLYLLAKKQLKAPFPSIIASAYLLYPPLQRVNTFDFHEIAFFPILALASLYFFEEKKWLSALFFLVLAACTKEDAILLTAFTGLYICAKSFIKQDGFQTYAGIGLAMISLVYFVITIKVIMPAFGGGLLRLDRYQELGGSVAEIVKTSIINPGLPLSTIFQWPKLTYVLWIFLPVAFLPIFGAPALLLILPGILENTLTNYPPQFSSLAQYDAIIIPGIFIGVVSGIRFLQNKWQCKERPVKQTLIFAIVLGFLLRSPLSPFSFPIYLFKPNTHWDSLREMTAGIPSNASVAAQAYIVPHLSQRQRIYMLGTEPASVDVVLLDSADLSGFANEALFQAYVDHYMNSGNYYFTGFQDRYFVLKRKTMQN